MERETKSPELPAQELDLLFIDQNFSSLCQGYELSPEQVKELISFIYSEFLPSLPNYNQDLSVRVLYELISPVQLRMKFRNDFLYNLWDYWAINQQPLTQQTLFDPLLSYLREKLNFDFKDLEVSPDNEGRIKPINRTDAEIQKGNKVGDFLFDFLDAWKKSNNYETGNKLSEVLKTSPNFCQTVDIFLDNIFLPISHIDVSQLNYEFFIEKTGPFFLKKGIVIGKVDLNNLLDEYIKVKYTEVITYCDLLSSQINQKVLEKIENKIIRADSEEYTSLQSEIESLCSQLKEQLKVFDLSENFIKLLSFLKIKQEYTSLQRVNLGNKNSILIEYLINNPSFLSENSLLTPSQYLESFYQKLISSINQKRQEKLESFRTKLQSGQLPAKEDEYFGLIGYLLEENKDDEGGYNFDKPIKDLLRQLLF